MSDTIVEKNGRLNWELNPGLSDLEANMLTTISQSDQLHCRTHKCVWC